MNILVAFNDGYTMPTHIMLKSVIANNKEDINIYCLYDELTAESMAAIHQLEDHSNVHVYFIHVDNSLFKYAPVHHHFSKEAYFRLLAHRFIDEKVDRILWLDGDTITNSSLKDFYYQDFDGKLFIAVEDMSLGKDEAKHITLQIPTNTIYINSGVLLMNLCEMRQRVNDEEIFNYIKEHQDLLEWVDQDVYNGMFYDEFKVISNEYWYNFIAERISFRNKKTVYSKAKVIHYCGKKKPWKKGYGDYGFDIYWKYGLLDNNEYIDVYKKARLSHIIYRPLKVIKKLRDSIWSRQRAPYLT